MITYRSHQEIAKIRDSAHLVAQTVQYVARMIEAGVTTADLDRAAEVYIRKHSGIPAFKGYRGFPATLCTSINHELRNAPAPARCPPAQRRSLRTPRLSVRQAPAARRLPRRRR